VTTAAIRILQDVGDAPPPPLAGALAAWVLRAGGRVHVVDRRGAGLDPGLPELPLFVHVDAGRTPTLDGLGWRAPPTFFGPGVDSEEGRAPLLAHSPRFVLGDPELAIAPDADLSTLEGLPLTTFTGFGRQRGAFRLLAGRGDRVRPVAALIREIVYLVEMSSLGHVLFDDADLGAYGDWVDRFRVELGHLPWEVTWEGAGHRRLS
jgi:hypothetical protein